MKITLVNAQALAHSRGMKNKYYVITPNNNVRGPFASVDEAQQDIPDSHGEPMHDHVTDMKGCSANLRHSANIGDAEINHVQTWVRDAGDDADETGYLIFEATHE